MPSAIDPTRPADTIPASKAEMRANLAAAKGELEHGGFAEGLSPVNYGPPASSKVVHHLAAIDDALASAGDATFLELDDAPSSYAGQANRYPRVKADETGLEFVDQAAGGDASTTSYAAPGTGAITRTVRDRLADFISVKDFGAKGDGVTDDTAAFNAACQAAAAHDIAHPSGTTESEQSLSGTMPRVSGAMIFIPPGFYRVKNWTIDRTVRITGCGRASRLGPTADAGANDFVMRVVFPSQTKYRNRGNHHAGLAIEHLMLDGIARLTPCGGLSLANVDRSTYFNLTIEEFQGSALRLERSCRESSFDALYFKFCGDATRPMVDIYDTGTFDRHNNLHFCGFSFEYPFADTIRIGSDRLVDNTIVRNIMFMNGLMHGMGGGGQGPYNRAGPTRHVVATQVQNLHFTGVRFHGWSGGHPAILCAAEDGDQPTNVHCVNCNFSRARADDGSGETGPDADSPHVRFDNVTTTFYEAANAYLGSNDAVVDKVGGTGTVRRWSWINA